jgi:queuine tRNA-ribosyltransferase
MSSAPKSEAVFRVLHTAAGCNARAATLQTAHGLIPTPIFMPVGTLATIKAVPQSVLQTEIDPPVILANTYHLYLRPGSTVLSEANGLHQFMHWDKALLTDSGGYQVYSLAANRKIKPEGVLFQSHIDGSRHLFTPENVVEMQRIIGSDILMVLDECPPYPCEYSYARKSLTLTHQWAAIGRNAFLNTQPHYAHTQIQFGIVQGSVYTDLRTESCQKIAELDFEGNAIGGLAVGEPENQLYDLTELCCSLLPPDKPRYLMGVGTPANLLEAIARGIDMFDCVMPTRNARHAHLFYRDGIRNLKNARYKNDFSPIDPEGTCPTDHFYTKAYLRHLFICQEILALTIATLHNLSFYLSLVREARSRILDGSFLSWKNALVPQLSKRIS